MNTYKLVDRTTRELLRRNNLRILEGNYRDIINQATTLDGIPIDVFIVYVARGEMFHWAIEVKGTYVSEAINYVVRNGILRFLSYLEGQLICFPV